jgi:hypothetical protein
MEEAVLVHERQALKYLVHNVPDFGLRKVLISLFHHLIKVAIHELEYKV